jgi:hypothetical protein
MIDRSWDGLSLVLVWFVEVFLFVFHYKAHALVELFSTCQVCSLSDADNKKNHD